MFRTAEELLARLLRSDGYWARPALRAAMVQLVDQHVRARETPIPTWQCECGCHHPRHMGCDNCGRCIGCCHDEHSCPTCCDALVVHEAAR